MGNDGMNITPNSSVAINSQGIAPKALQTHASQGHSFPHQIPTRFFLGNGRVINTSGESNRPLTPILLKSIAIHLPFLSRLLMQSMPSFWQKVLCTPHNLYHDTPPICIADTFCRSIRVGGRWSTPKIPQITLRELIG